MDNLIIFCAKYLVFVIPLIVIYVWLHLAKSSKKQFLITFILANIAATVLAMIFSKLHYNARPFVSDGTPALFSHGTDNGFPSEHTVLAMTLTSMIYYYNRKLAALALVITILVGWGRVAGHVHHGIDILAGILIGALAGTIGYYIAKKLVPIAEVDKPKLSSLKK